MFFINARGREELKKIDINRHSDEGGTTKEGIC